MILYKSLRMRRWFYIGLLWCVAAFGLAAAETFVLSDGSTLVGDLIPKSSFNRDGVMVKTPDGKFSRRVPYKQLSKETLQRLLSHPEARPFVEPLVEPPPEAIQIVEETKREKREIKIKPVPNKLEMPAAPPKFIALAYSPVTLLLFILIYVGSIYGAYEIAIFKNRPAWLVCGTAAVLPVLGAVLFLLLPAAPVKSQEQLAAEAAAAEGAQPAEAEPLPEDMPPPPPEEEAPSGPQYPPTQVFARGQFIINRRFFETKFAPYLKPVLGDEEKDMQIIVRSARGEYTGQKFSKITPNEIYLLVAKGPATEEIKLPFIEITEVILKHKDAPMP